MIRLLSQFTLVVMKFYQERGKQIIDFIRDNPTEAPSMFPTIRVDIYNLTQVINSLEEQLDIFEHHETADLYTYKEALKGSVETMQVFLDTLEGIVQKGEDLEDLNLDFGDYNIEDTDGGAA